MKELLKLRNPNDYNIKQNLGVLLEEMEPFNNLTKSLLDFEFGGTKYQVQITITADEDDFIDEFEED